MMPTQAKRIWQQACDEYLQGQVSALSFSTWFTKVEPYLKDDETIALSVPDDMTVSYTHLDVYKRQN